MTSPQTINNLNQLKMLDLTVVILTKDEELHIGRCIENVLPVAKRIFVIDSFSTDHTLEIARKYPNVTILQNKWVNNYASQFNWAIDNLPPDTGWVLRLDADEYLLPELVDEIKQKLPSIDASVSGVVLNRRHIFMGKWMKRGIYPVKLLRIFRYGKGKCEQRLMDEHIQLTDGNVIEFDNDFCDHNLNNLSWFCHKHVNYAVREAADLLDIEYNITGAALTDDNKEISKQAIAKRNKKHKYARQPLFWRAAAYFLYRYVAKGAFLEGKEGFLFSFIQGWWYRTLVDAKILEIKRKSGGDPEEIKRILREEYNIGF